MRKLIVAATVLLALSAFSACTSYNYYTAARNKTNLNNYRTFAWMPMDRSSRPTISQANDAAIKDATTAALQQKGLRIDQRHPDLVVSYTNTVGRGSRTNYYSPYYGGWGYGGWGWGGGFGFGWGGGWGWGGYYRPWYYAGPAFAYGGPTYAEKEHYKEGTIIIDLIDTRTRRVVWRGYGVGEVHNAEKTARDIPKVVDGIISQLEISPSVPNRRSI